MMEETIKMSGIHIKEMPHLVGFDEDNNVIHQEELRKYMIRILDTDIGEVRAMVEVDTTDGIIGALAKGISHALIKVMDRLDIA